LNYLAHAYLSFGDPEVLAGNLISDFIKGKKKYDYPAGIQKGIALHRAIDTYTDDHPATKEAKEILRPVYRLYSGALVDVLYDHFLATDVNEFTKESLFDFSQQVYASIDRQIQWLPERFTKMFPYMKTQNWLFNYHTMWGTEKSLEGVVRRSRYLTESGAAYHLFEQHYQLFSHCYRQFWKDMLPFARQQYEILRANNL
jgi:acyl carrier protein phosphodiesterase